MKRLVLQEALADKAPGELIEFNKKLVGLEDLGKEGVRVSFEDGTERIVDLVVGADGIRSVCRPVVSFSRVETRDGIIRLILLGQVVRKHMAPDYPLDYACTWSIPSLWVLPISHMLHHRPGRLALLGPRREAEAHPRLAPDQHQLVVWQSQVTLVVAC